MKKTKVLVLQERNTNFFSAQQQNDILCSPIKDSAETNCLYLKEAREMFVSWRDSKNTGLTRETFLACIQTMGAIPDLAMYLQEKHGVSYLLMAKLTFDPIEGRFGWYRQVNVLCVSNN